MNGKRVGDALNKLFGCTVIEQLERWKDHIAKTLCTDHCTKRVQFVLLFGDSTDSDAPVVDDADSERIKKMSYRSDLSF